MSESLMLLFMLSTAITLLLIYFRLREIDHNAAEHTRLIRHDIIEREGYISAAIGERAVQISNMEKNLTTEIACLATKNNEDIKRMKGDYQQWDMIAFDGEQWIIHKIDENVNGDTFYRIHNAKGQITNVNSKDMQHATFVKHVGSPFDEQK